MSGSVLGTVVGISGSVLGSVGGLSGSVLGTVVDTLSSSKYLKFL